MSWRIKFYFSVNSYLRYDKSITYALQRTKKKKSVILFQEEFQPMNFACNQKDNFKNCYINLKHEDKYQGGGINWVRGFNKHFHKNTMDVGTGCTDLNKSNLKDGFQIFSLCNWS